MCKKKVTDQAQIKQGIPQVLPELLNPRETGDTARGYACELCHSHRLTP